MKIGQLAAATRTKIETIRYYERAGLLANPDRSDANCRMYNTRHMQRLTFIRHCRYLEMMLDEIRLLLPFLDAPQRECQEVNTLLDVHLGHVKQRINELRQLERQLKDLRAQCSEGRDADHCGILAEFAKNTPPEPQRPGALHLTHSQCSGETPGA
jgi:Cd(II)/Pb(II)-responsive transcriptional regulator